MVWRIELSPNADKQLDRIDRQSAIRILKFLRSRLSALDDPRQLGAALSGPFSGYWRYRIGDYRVICELRDTELIILVVEVGHRREIYR